MQDLRPVEREVHRLQKRLESSRSNGSKELRKELRQNYTFEDIISQNHQMQNLFNAN